MPRPPITWCGRTSTGIADPLGDLARLVRVGRRPPLRARARPRSRAKRPRSSAASIASSGSPSSGMPAAASAGASRSGVWPPNETATPTGCSSSHTSSTRLVGERLEVEPVGRVVVGRHRLRVRVHEHRLVPELLQRLRGVDAAVVELDRLPDPVRPAADHDDRAAGRLGALVVALVGDVVVRRPRLELAGARVDGEPGRLPRTARSLSLASATSASAVGEVRVDPAAALEPAARRLEQRGPSRSGTGSAAAGEQHARRSPGTPTAGASRPSIAFRNASANVRPSPSASPTARISAPSRARRLRELLEVEARRLHRDVVERRLERRGRLAGDVVRQLVERVADREQRGELRDREAGRLRGERRGARDARVHLDHAQLVRLRVDGELDVRAAGRDADRARASRTRPRGARWYAASGSVCCGAIVHESPVCTPIGSRFSIEQTTTALPRASHITSSSCSCQPARYSSTSTCPVGLAARPCATTARSSAGRVRDAAAGAAERERRPHDRRRRERRRRRAVDDHALRHAAGPTDSTVARKSSRSSARRIAPRSAPISSTPSGARARPRG